MKPSTITRRTALRAGGGALALPFLARAAHAVDVTWHIGHIAPANAAVNQRLLEAADSISKRSEGRIAVVVGAAASMGQQAGLLDQVRNGGGVDMALVTGLTLSRLVPEFQVPATGFLFDDDASVWRNLDGDLGRYLTGRANKQLGIQIMDKVWNYGFRHITNSVRPIKTASDIAGLRIRTVPEVEQEDMFKSLDTIPITMSTSYLKEALRHHQIDGQDGVLPLVGLANLYQVQSHCALTRHGWDGHWICYNTASWKKLPERFQAIIANTLNGLAARQRDDTAQEETNMRASFEKAGMVFSDPDRASFREVLRKKEYYSRVKARLGPEPWRIMQPILGFDT